jgi:hypothetical protein
VFDLADNVRKAGVCPAIIEPAVFEHAQAILARRAPRTRRPLRGRGALAGVLLCARCGRKMSATHWKGRMGYVCHSGSLQQGKTNCRHWRVYEDEILPRICSRLVETVDAALLKALHAQPPHADRLADLDMSRQHMAELERQIDQAADRYLKAPAELMPKLAERLKAMRDELTECEDRARELSAAANEGAVANFTRWWESVRGQLLLVQVAPGPDGQTAVNPAAAVFWQASRETYAAEQAEQRPQDSPCAFVEPAALRSLLIRLGVRVECSFEEATTAKKQTPGRGRGPRYVLRRAVMTTPEGTCANGAKYEFRAEASSNTLIF